MDGNIINTLIHLFDDTYNDDVPLERKIGPNRKIKNKRITRKMKHLKINRVSKNQKISRYIADERKAQHLDDSVVEIKGKFFGYTEKEDDPTLLLEVLKNGKGFIHLTLHLAVKGLEPHAAGVFHIAKNIYHKQHIHSKKIKSYAIITVIHPPNKPHSLEFVIEDGYNTSNVKISNQYNTEVQQEMQVIITVLNRLFDEDNPQYYVGTYSKNKQVGNHFFSMYPKINEISGLINKHSTHTSRKNRGISLNPSINSNMPSINIPNHAYSARKYINRPNEKISNNHLNQLRTTNASNA